MILCHVPKLKVRAEILLVFASKTIRTAFTDDLSSVILEIPIPNIPEMLHLVKESCFKVQEIAAPILKDPLKSPCLFDNGI
jgi:hypothetical protein